MSTGNYGIEEVRKMCVQKGFDFRKSQFYEWFKNPVYCGRIVIAAYKNEPMQIVKGNHEPLITEELYDKVQLVLAGKRFKNTYKTCLRDELPLRGFLTCPRCSRKLCGSGSTGGSGIKHYYYHCKHGCKERVKANQINDAFSELISTFQFKKGVQDMYEQILQDVFKSKNSQKAVSKQTLELEIEKNKERLNRAQQMMLDGEMDMAEYKEIKMSIEPKIENLLNEQLGANQMEIEYRGYLKKGLSAIQNLGHLFDYADIAGKQIIVRSTLKENAVFSEGRVRTGKLNRLIELTTYADGHCKKSESRKEGKNCTSSGIVPGGGLEPNFKTEDFHNMLEVIDVVKPYLDL